MARRAGKMRGDMRAMEIQANDVRTNPVQGGSNGRMVGAGATPSMGLSQFRGGIRWSVAEKDVAYDYLESPAFNPNDSKKWVKMSEYLATQDIHRTAIQCRTWYQKVVAEKPEAETKVSQSLANMGSLGRGKGEVEEESESDEEGQGGAHHRTSNAASRMDASHPTALGIRLRQHLHKLHGAGWYDSFKKGLSTAGTIAKYAAPFVLTPAAGTAVSAGLGALGFGRHSQRGARGKSMEKHGGAMYPSGAYEGQGREREDEAFSGVMGRGGRRKRAPAGANDGRRKRAEVVKRVMNEKGMSMIEASKYVKAHGLY